MSIPILLYFIWKFCQVLQPAEEKQTKQIRINIFSQPSSKALLSILYFNRKLEMSVRFRQMLNKIVKLTLFDGFRTKFPNNILTKGAFPEVQDHSVQQFMEMLMI